MDYPISNSLFDDFLKCKYKAYLKSQGKSGQKSPFERLEFRLVREYRDRAYRHLSRLNQSIDIPQTALPLAEVDNHQYGLILNVTVRNCDILAHFDALEQVSGSRMTQPEYMPVTFVHHEKIAKDHKLVFRFTKKLTFSSQ
jgi:hypothetical protein